MLCVRAALYIMLEDIHGSRIVLVLVLWGRAGLTIILYQVLVPGMFFSYILRSIFLSVFSASSILFPV